MADSARLRGWKWDIQNCYLEGWVNGTNVVRFGNGTCDPAMTIINCGALHGLLIQQNTSTSGALSTCGALHIDNSCNNRSAIVVRSTNSCAQAGPLVRLDSSGACYDQPIMLITKDSSNSREEIEIQSPNPAISFVQTDIACCCVNAFELQLQGSPGVFQINSRNDCDTSFENVVLVSRQGDGGEVELKGFLTLNTQACAPAGSAGQVKIFSQLNACCKVQLMAEFPSGAAQQISVEP